MLRKETVAPTTLGLLNELMKDEVLNDFFLAGGTALSLQIGHRISIDLDLFSQKSFDSNRMLDHLQAGKKFRVGFQDKNTLKGEIDNVQVDFITHAYPLVKELQIIEGVRLASLEDISAMKLNAIVGNGTRLKDFIDIIFLSCHLSLEQMIRAYEVKYEYRNPIMLTKSLGYTIDINKDEPIQLLAEDYSWESLEIRLNQMLETPDIIFEELPFAR